MMIDIPQKKNKLVFLDRLDLVYWKCVISCTTPRPADKTIKSDKLLEILDNAHSETTFREAERRRFFTAGRNPFDCCQPLTYLDGRCEFHESVLQDALSTVMVTGVLNEATLMHL